MLIFMVLVETTRLFFTIIFFLLLGLMVIRFIIGQFISKWESVVDEIHMKNLISLMIVKKKLLMPSCHGHGNRHKKVYFCGPAKKDRGLPKLSCDIATTYYLVVCVLPSVSTQLEKQSRHGYSVTERCYGLTWDMRVWWSYFWTSKTLHYNTHVFGKLVVSSFTGLTLTWTSLIF